MKRSTAMLLVLLLVGAFVVKAMISKEPVAAASNITCESPRHDYYGIPCLEGVQK